MDVVILLVFISLGLVVASLFFFVHRLGEGDFEHGERLALAPLEEDTRPGAHAKGSGSGSSTPTDPGEDGDEGPRAREPRTDDHASQLTEGGSTHVGS